MEETVLVCSPGCPGIYRDLPGSALLLIELKACTTMLIFTLNYVYACGSVHGSAGVQVPMDTGRQIPWTWAIPWFWELNLGRLRYT